MKEGEEESHSRTPWLCFMPLLLVRSSVQPVGSGHLPPGRLSPPRALFGQGPYLHHSHRLHHPCARVSGSPRAERRKARRGPDFEDLFQSPLLLTGGEKEERNLAFASVGSFVVRGGQYWRKVAI